MNETDYASHADVNTPYDTGDSTEDVINSLECDSIKLIKWFVDNQMRADKDECHLLLSRGKNITINIDDVIIGKSICEKLWRAFSAKTF